MNGKMMREENLLPQKKLEQNLFDRKKIYDYYEYERNREKEYPSVKDQLDALYHDLKSGNLNNGGWIKSIEKIKKDYPKPETNPPIE